MRHALYLDVSIYGPTHFSYISPAFPICGGTRAGQVVYIGNPTGVTCPRCLERLAALEKKGTTREFQPNFVAYAKSRGVTPQQALTSFRGHEYIIWINQRWSEWDAITHAGKSPAYRPDTEHAAFGAWLAAGCPGEVQG